ncbi:MAG TPA: universal stress protein [Kribbella sp.]|nr:universal stress protein [Kribbella sp.]
MTVLVGYVPSPEGEAALRAGVEEARRRGETLLVVNTSRGDAPVDPTLAQKHDLELVERDLTELGVDFQLKQLIGGRDAADEIVELAASENVSLLVIGLRHRTPVGKLILGSSAQRILLDAPCPVLAVKAHRA